MTLDAYEADTVASITETLEINGYAHLADHERIAASAAEKRGQVASILASGLDIGTIIEHVVPVHLHKSPSHGWVFVVEKDTHIRGQMYPVSRYVK